MKLPLQLDYAVKALVYLGKQEGPATTDQIAAATQCCPSHLGRVIRALKPRFLKPVRGRKGGVRLACDLETTTVLDVMKELKIRCVSTPAEETASVVSRAIQHLENELDAVFEMTIASLILQAAVNSIPARQTA